MIKTVIFDLGQVIIPFDFHRAYSRVEFLTGTPAAEVRAKIAPTGLVQEFETGQIAPEWFAARLSSLLGLETSYREFCELWCSIFFPETLLADEFLAALKAKHRLVLLSNTNAIHFDMVLENYPLLRHFDALVLSYKVGAMKPSRMIYDAAVEAARCHASECFFADDLGENVEAARAAGIDAVQFLSAEQIQRELKARGVTW